MDEVEHALADLARLRAIFPEMDGVALARRIDRNASSIRRLFTANRARPELPSSLRSPMPSAPRSK